MISTKLFKNENNRPRGKTIRFLYLNSIFYVSIDFNCSNWMSFKDYVILRAL